MRSQTIWATILKRFGEITPLMWCALGLTNWGIALFLLQPLVPPGLKTLGWWVVLQGGIMGLQVCVVIGVGLLWKGVPRSTYNIDAR